MLTAHQVRSTDSTPVRRAEHVGGTDARVVAGAGIDNLDPSSLSRRSSRASSPSWERRGRRAFAMAASAAVFLSVAPAFADQPDPAVAADDLFQRGKRMLQSGDVEHACPLFAESYRLDPAGGTLQNLAACYEAEGKWASAQARFQELRTLSKNANPPRTDRIKLAEDHLATLGPRVSRLVVVAPSDAPADTVVEVDGVSYRRAAWSTGIAVDPGKHDVVVSAPEKKPFRSSVAIAKEGAEQKLTVPALESAPHVDDSRPIEGDRREPNRTRTAGFIVGGVGVATLGAGALFAVLAAVKNGDGKDKCLRSGNPSAPASDFDNTTGRCFVGSSAWQDANATKDDARTFANVANVLIPVGVVGAAVGTWLILRKGSAETSRTGASARVSMSLNGVSIDGSF